VIGELRIKRTRPTSLFIHCHSQRKINLKKKERQWRLGNCQRLYPPRLDSLPQSPQLWRHSRCNSRHTAHLPKSPNRTHKYSARLDSKAPTRANRLGSSLTSRPDKLAPLNSYADFLVRPRSPKAVVEEEPCVRFWVIFPLGH